MKELKLVQTYLTVKSKPQRSLVLLIFADFFPYVKSEILKGMGKIHDGCGCWVPDLHRKLLTDEFHRKVKCLNARNFIKLCSTIRFKLWPFKFIV
jgi:hypothetical protein